MGKRKNGEGSYGFKMINGVKYRRYIAPDKSWEVCAKTAKELEEKKKLKEQKVREAVKVDERIKTVSDLCLEWLSVVKPDIAPSTYDAYENAYKRIIDFDGYDLGNKQLPKLIPDMIETFLYALAKRYSKGSIDKSWTVIKQSILYGQKKGYISSALRLDDVKKPKEINVAVKKKDIQFIIEEDMEILYKESKRLTSRNTPLYGTAAQVVVFIMYSGLRVSEAVGLKWQYVEPEYKRIVVKESSQKIVARDKEGNAVMNGEHKTYVQIQKNTKTESGERVIPLPPRAREVLQSMDFMHPNHRPSDHVFLTDVNKPYDRRQIERTLSRMMKNAGLFDKGYTPHSLRHGYGSILLSKGVDIKTVSVLLGHKDVSTTYNIYIHVLEKDKELAVMKAFDL